MSDAPGTAEDEVPQQVQATRLSSSEWGLSNGSASYRLSGRYDDRQGDLVWDLFDEEGTLLRIIIPRHAGAIAYCSPGEIRYVYQGIAVGPGGHSELDVDVTLEILRIVDPSHNYERGGHREERLVKIGNRIVMYDVALRSYNKVYGHYKHPEKSVNVQRAWERVGMRLEGLYELGLDKDQIELMMSLRRNGVRDTELLVQAVEAITH